MGNYDQLKNAVAAVIYDNGAEYITGDRLQDVLVTIINSVGAGATFAGVALPNTNPGTPDPNMFYLAGKAGTYTNFNVTITKGLWVFTNDGGTWTGTDLQVSMLFATGEDVTETSIAEDITQGAFGDLPTVGAVRGALEAENKKFFNEVAYADIDDLATFDEAFAGSESGTPAYYTVYVTVGSHKVKVGTMEIISDNMAHVVTQVMVTHYVLDENGAITGAHSDGDLFRIFRSKKIHGGTLPTDDWTPWAYVNETEWKKIVSGADAVPTPGSTNVVKSGGVAGVTDNLFLKLNSGEKLATASVSGSGSSSFSVSYNFVAGHEYVIRIDIDEQTVSTIKAWGEGGTEKSIIAENATLKAGENYFKYTADEGAARVNVNNVSGRTLTMSVYDYNSDFANWLLDSMRSLPELAGNYTSSNRDSKVDAGVYANNSEQPGLLLVFYKKTVGVHTATVQYEMIAGSADLIIRRREMDLTAETQSWGDWDSVNLFTMCSELSEAINDIGELDGRVTTLEKELNTESLRKIGDYSGTSTTAISFLIGEELVIGKTYRFDVELSQNSTNSNVRLRKGTSGTNFENVVENHSFTANIEETFEYVVKGYDDTVAPDDININNLTSGTVVNISIYEVINKPINEKVKELDERVTALEEGGGDTMPRYVIKKPVSSYEDVEVYQRYGDTNKYLMLLIRHDINTSGYDPSSYDQLAHLKNLWRLMGGGVYKRNAVGTFTPVSGASGMLYQEENEMAIQFATDDYVVGGTHGFESIVLSGQGIEPCFVQFIADGVAKSYNDIDDGMECQEFKYVQYSALLARADTNHPIEAYHLKETVFKDCGYEVTNTVKVVGDEGRTINSFFVGLVCIGKNASEKLLAPVGEIFNVESIRPIGSSSVRFPTNPSQPTGYGYDWPGIRTQDMWSETSGIRVSIESEALLGYTEAEVDNFYNMARRDDTKYYRVVRAEKHFSKNAVAKARMKVMWDL